MKTYKAGELREDMLVVPVHMLEGFALVPVDPTTEMLDAAQSCYGSDSDVYRAMLAAAPKGDSHE